MSRPYTFEDSIRRHDLAVQRWLDGLLIDYGDLGNSTKARHPIISIYASPSRPFAAIPDLLVSRGFISAPTAAEMREFVDDDRAFNVLPLPIATIQRLDARPDSQLSGVPKTMRRLHLDPATNQWEVHRWPAHYLTDYTISFWCHKRYTEAYIREWVYAQLGNVGLQENECLIPVDHDGPWGTMQQMFRMESSSDASDLEGTRPRYLRFDFSFTLRTWIMREPVAAADPIEAGGVSLCLEVTAPGSQDADTIPEPTKRIEESQNLFRNPFSISTIASKWPRTGTAKVSWPTNGPTGAPRNGLTLDVADDADSVVLAERILTRWPEGYAIVSVSFDYRADAPFVLEVSQRDFVGTPEIVTAADAVEVPRTGRTWARVHRFFVVRQPSAIISVVGVSGPNRRRIRLDQIDIRYQFPAASIDTASIVPVAGGNEYRWAGLAPRPYLIIVTLTSTSGAVTLEARNDDTAPSAVIPRVVDASEQVGAVFLIQPISTTLALFVPAGTALASLTLCEYAGAYNGSAV